MANLEKLIELEIKDYLTKTGWFVFKISQPSTHSRNIKGLPDLFALKQGCWVLIEVKSPSGKQSPEQANLERVIVEHGGEYILVHSLDELIEKLC